MVSSSRLTYTNGGHLTEKGKWACVFHYQHLKSYCGVAKLVGVKDTTVKRWVIQHEEFGHVNDNPTGNQDSPIVIRTKKWLKTFKREIDQEYAKGEAIGVKELSRRMDVTTDTIRMTAKDWEDHLFQDEKIFYCRSKFPKSTVQDPNLPPLSKKRESRWYGGKGCMFWMAYSIK